MRTYIAAIAATLLASCASIVSKSTYPVVIATDPPGSEVEVSNADGEMIYAGSTPTILELAAGNGSFGGTSYVFVSGDWSAELKATSDPWVIGNAVFGFAGILGIIIDGASGAAFKLPERYTLLLYVPDPEEPEPEPERKSFGDPDATRF